MSDIAKLRPVADVATPDPSSGRLLTIIEKLATNPDVDVEKVERFYNLYELERKREAEAQFWAAFAAMQPELPIIDRRGGITNNQGKVQSKYAKWEDVVDAIRPTLSAHGFALSFRSEVLEDKGRIDTLCILAHKSGHKEVSPPYPLPFDASGSKNAVQAIGSSTSYGKRYTAFSMLNIVAREEDDDGAASLKKVVSDDQADTLRKMITASKTDINKFLRAFKAESLSDMLDRDYDRATAMLSQKLSKMQETHP